MLKFPLGPLKLLLESMSWGLQELVESEKGVIIFISALFKFKGRTLIGFFNFLFLTLVTDLVRKVGAVKLFGSVYSEEDARMVEPSSSRLPK